MIVAKVKAYKILKDWHWVLIGKNNEILAASETYSSKTKCMKTARQVAEQLEVKFDG